MAGDKKMGKVKGQKPKGGLRLKVGAAVLLVLVLGISYLYLNYGWLPAALISAKSYNSAAIVGILSQHIESMNTLELNYTGSIVVNNTDPHMYVNVVRYYNTTFMSMGINGLPVFGNLTATMLADGKNVSRVCTKTWNDSASSHEAAICAVPSNSMAVGAVEAAMDRIVNTSSLSNLQTTSYGLTLYHLRPCYSAAGSGTVMINGALVNETGYVPANFSFSACLDAKYGVPDYVGATLHSGGKYVHVNLTESLIYTGPDITIATTGR